MTIETGGVAFPQSIVIDDQGRPSTLADYRRGYEGMTLRDYFAGQALIGTLYCVSRGLGEDIEIISKKSYELSDAMLKARTGGKE